MWSRAIRRRQILWVVRGKTACQRLKIHDNRIIVKAPITMMPTTPLRNVVRQSSPRTGPLLMIVCCRSPS